MPAIIKTYLVVAPLSVVVEDDGVAISYQPGAIFSALDSNPSVIRLLGSQQIVETFGIPETGATVIQGAVGPPGPIGPDGPIGPAGGLLNALVIDNTTGGNDIEITDNDNIVGQSDGGWDIGSPDGGPTKLRPATIYAETDVIVGDANTITITSNAITGFAGVTLVSGAGADLLLTGGNADALSNDDGGTVIITAGNKDGIGTNGTLEFRGNFANPLVMEIDGAVNLYDASANKVIELLADPGALRVGRNTQLTAAEGDFIFGNDGTVAGVATGLLLWDASTVELGLRTNTNSQMMIIGGAANELAVFGSTGIRGLKVTVNGGTAEFRAEDAANRTGVDSVLAVLLRGGDSEGIENGGVLTLAGGRALGTGTDAVVQVQTGGLDRWHFDPSGHLLATSDNASDIGASGATRPRSLFLSTSLNVGSGITPSLDNGDVVAGNGLSGLVYDASVSGLIISETIAATPAGIVGIIAAGNGLLGAFQSRVAGTESPEIAGSRSRGTIAARTTVQINDTVMRVRGCGFEEVGGNPLAMGMFTINSEAVPTATVAPGYLGFHTQSTTSGINTPPERWRIVGDGHLRASLDDTYDIGAAGTARPRRAYIATEVVVGGTVTIGTASIVGSVDLAIIAGGANDLTLAARGSAAIPFNEAGHLTLTGTTSGFSLVRAINTIEAAGGALLSTILSIGNSTGGTDLEVTNGDVVTFNSDTGISRLGAGSLAIGNGTDGVVSGTISLTNLVVGVGGATDVLLKTVSNRLLLRNTTDSADVGIVTSQVEFGDGGALSLAGAGTPEGVTTAPLGSTFHRTDGGVGTSLYIKESGAGNTGWAPAIAGLVDLQRAYDGGGSIATTGGSPFAVSGTEIISLVTSSGQNIVLGASGGGPQRLTLTSAGTGTVATSAIALDATAGGISIDAALTSCIIVSGSGEELQLAAIGGGTNRLTVTSAGSGIGATAALALDATIGGFSIDAALFSNLTVTGSGESLLVNAAGGGAQQLILASAGTGADAIDIGATGGIDIDAGGGISLDAANTTASNFTSANTTDSTSTTLTIACNNTGGVAGDATLDIDANSDNGTSVVNIGALNADTINLGTVTEFTSGGPNQRSGVGTPEGAITAPPGSLFLRSNGSNGSTLYVKETGAGNTGWTAFRTSTVEVLSSQAQAAGTSLSFAVLPDTLSADGDYLKVQIWGKIGDDGGSDEYDINWGGVTIVNNLDPGDNNTEFKVELTIVRTGATTQDIPLVNYNDNNDQDSGEYDFVAGTATLGASNTIEIVCLGSGGTAPIARGMIVTKYSAP